MSSWCQASAPRALIGLTPGRRGLLSHRLFSRQAPDFVSEPAEMQQALSTVSQALSRLKVHKTVTWLLARGFDDGAVWRTIWEQQEQRVARISQTDRTVAFQDRQGQWHEGDIAQATAELRPLARVETTLEVKRGKPVPRDAQREGAPHQRRKVSVSEGIRVVGTPYAHPTDPCHVA